MNRQACASISLDLSALFQHEKGVLLVLRYNFLGYFSLSGKNMMCCLESDRGYAVTPNRVILNTHSWEFDVQVAYLHKVNNSLSVLGY